MSNINPNSFLSRMMRGFKQGYTIVISNDKTKETQTVQVNAFSPDRAVEKVANQMNKNKEEIQDYTFTVTEHK